MSYPELLKAQASWADALLHAEAQRNGTAIRARFGNAMPDVESNLFRQLHCDTRREFELGDGDELGIRSKQRPGLSSIRSSSALAVNVFDYWRTRDLAPLAKTFGVHGQFNNLQFEQKFPHGVRGKSPNLDVVLRAPMPAQPLAVECKFAEPYDVPAKHIHPPLDTKYFQGRGKGSGTGGRWEKVGLPRCEVLARGIGHEIEFRRLGAGQLLKHLLGLSVTGEREYRAGPPRLRYLWYDTRTVEAEEHRREVERFAQQVDEHLDFAALTFQQLFAELTKAGEPDYVEYLRARYFPAGSTPLGV